MNLDMLNIDTDVEENEDYIPGGDFSFNTGVYPMKVDIAYMGESTRGAVSLTAHFKEVDGNRTHRETFYVTSGKAKGRSNTYTDRGGKKRLLPGMEAMNQLAIVVTGQKLAQLSPEKRTIKLYNYEAKKDLPTDVPALTDLIGKTVHIALTKCRENKRVKVGTDYVDSAEERIFNEATKFLYEDGHTVAEKIADSVETTWQTGWTEKCPADYVKDSYKEVAVGAGVEAASADAAETNAESVKGLFDD